MRTILLSLLLAGGLAAQPRMPQLKLEDTTGEQRALAERMLKQTRSGLTGPFNPMLRSAEMSQSLMDLYLYFRYKTALPRSLVELAILTTGREWSAPFEWYMHYPIGVTEGLSEDLLGQLREGKRPSGMKADETTVYDFATELLRTHQVSDATYQKALTRLGEKGVVDLATLVTTYVSYAALLNINQLPLPPGSGPRYLPVKSGIAPKTSKAK
jgi:4-carboxymuconolactone decarboxylase